MNITESETRVLRAIATNCYNILNYGIPEKFEEARAPIWSNSINDAEVPSGITGKTLSATCGSLACKGLIGTSNDNDTIWLTKQGFDTMMSFYNNKLK